MAQLLLVFGLIFSIIISLSSATFAFYKKDKETTILKAVELMNTQTINKINECFEDLSSISKLPLYTDYLSESQDSFLYFLDLFNSTNRSNLQFQKQFYNLAEKVFNYKSYINSVYIFNTHGNYEAKLAGDYFYSGATDPLNSKWYNDCVELSGKPLFVNTFALPDARDMKGNQIYVFSVARAIVNVDKSSVIGVMLINAKYSYLSAMCNKMLIIPDENIYIIDKAGNIVYDKNISNVSQKLEKSLFDIVNGTDSGSKNVSINNLKHLIIFNSSESTGWKVINVIPENKLFESINQLKYLTIIITASLILLVSLFIILLSSQIVTPLKRLIIMMKLFEKGDFDIKIKFNNRNEIGQLSKSFNKMTSKIKRLVKTVYIDQITQKDLELQMLQNQINPHFIYNTIESIHMMAEINNDDETSLMARSFGKILRYGISKTQKIVSVKDEVENLNDYVQLQKIRFSNKFNIVINISEDIYQCKIIRLILQPLVENAINHGISSRLKDGLICVEGWKDGPNLIFQISDNGKGIAEGELSNLNDYINGLNNDFKSIGLKNVNKRLQLHYGEGYEIRIFSKFNEGTTVRVNLPYS